MMVHRFQRGVSTKRYPLEAESFCVESWGNNYYYQNSQLCPHHFTTCHHYHKTILQDSIILSAWKSFLDASLCHLGRLSIQLVVLNRFCTVWRILFDQARGAANQSSCLAGRSISSSNKVAPLWFVCPSFHTDASLRAICQCFGWVSLLDYSLNRSSLLREWGA